MVISTKLALEQIFVHCFVVRHMRLGWLLWLVFRVPHSHSRPSAGQSPASGLATDQHWALRVNWIFTNYFLIYSYFSYLLKVWKFKKNDLAFYIWYYLLMVWHLKFYLIYIICSISYMFLFFVVLTDEWWLIANLCRDEVFPKLDAKANI